MSFSDRLRILESFGIVKLNAQTAEYEFTEFGKRFFEPRPAVG